MHNGKKIRFSAIAVFEYLKTMPQVSVGILTNALNISEPTARSVLTQLEKLGIVKEITGKKRDRVYVYKKYLALLEQGAEPL